ncbi:MAG: ABC-2 transporter permease [Clostridia bacterium]|nr:ABC-2 transporter permease [Clostridia bacterium]
MINLLNKELRLSAHLLSYLFLAFSLMALIPGYPILLSAFFICFGLFQTFQNGRETNDVLYSALLPIDKKDVVKARYIFVCLIQITAFILMAGLTALRMVFFASAAPYMNNAMMNSNPVFLAWTLLIFALFNTLFVGLFYKTAYRFGKPFIAFIVASMPVICIAEVLKHHPGLEFLNTSDRLPLQLMLMLSALAVFVSATIISCKAAQRNFEQLDL